MGDATYIRLKQGGGLTFKESACKTVQIVWTSWAKHLVLV